MAKAEKLASGPETGAAQVSGQERRDVFGQIGGDGQGDDVGAVHVVRLGVHAKVEDRVAARSLGVADFKLQVHRRKYRLGRQ